MQLTDIPAFFEDAITETLNQRLKLNRENVAGVLKQHFLAIKKKPLPDLEAQVKKMQEQITLMVELLKIEKSKTGWVVTATGDGDTTLTSLMLGSAWFEPSPYVAQLVLAALG